MRSSGCRCRVASIHPCSSSLRKAARVSGCTTASRRLSHSLLVRRLDFLQADDVGTLLLEPIEQPREPAVDAVDVIGSDLQHDARSLETTSDRIDAEISKVRAFRFDCRREAGHTRVAVLLPHAINSSREMQVAKRKKAKKGKKK